MCMSVFPACVYVQCTCSALRGWKRMSGPLELDLTSRHQPLRGFWELNLQVFLIAELSLQAQQNRLYYMMLQNRMPPQKKGKNGWHANLAQNSVLFGEILYGKKFLLSFSVGWFSRKILFLPFPNSPSCWFDRLSGTFHTVVLQGQRVPTSS